MGSQRIVIGTAGHVDHGKTALVLALTGIDTDRLKEEKRRGITLELGFAHLGLPGGAEAGLIDVPGHERFVRAMVAGAGGIDLVLLVVASDEGVMPQTREHIDICRLLGVRAGVVALTKSDLLPELGPEFRAALDADLAAAVAGTFLEGAPVVPVSARTGDGIEALKAALALAARAVPERPSDGPAYLPLDRAFTLKGFGTVVTGTLLSGSLRAGADAELIGSGSSGIGPLRIRSLQVHGRDTPQALAGQRTAVNLSDVEVDAVSRGMVLTTPGGLAASPMLDVAIEVLSAAERPLRARTKLLCHLGTGVAPCTVALLDRPELGPGGRAFAQLRLLHPLPALPGQRFILRGFRALPGRGQTVAGGTVLAVVPRKRRRGARATDGLAALRDGSLEERIAWLLEDAGHAGLPAGALPQRTAASLEAVAAVLDQLSARGAAVLFDRDRRAYVGGRCFESLVTAAAGEVAQHHRRNPLSPSMPKEELRQRLTPGMDGRLFQKVLQRLGGSGQAVVEGEGVRSPAHAQEVRSADQDLRSQLAGLLRGGGLSPPTPAEIAARLGIEEGRVVAVLKLLAGEGSAVRVKDDLYFESGTIEGLKERLLGHLKAKGAITTPEFKELTGATRKFTIPLAEFFDQQKLTLRLGEKRVLRGEGRAGVAR